MYLCFGTFATVLNCCRQGIQQAALIARIAKCVDRHSSYIGNEDRYKKENEWTIMGDGPATSKLLHCVRNFVFDDNQTTNKPNINDVIENFETNVAPFITEDKKATVIFTLLDIIRQDKNIDSKTKECFKKYLGASKQELLQKREYIFSDFLGRILLYTVDGNVDNTLGKEYVRLITKDYIGEIYDRYADEYTWRANTQTLELTFITIYLHFCETMECYQIDKFIERIDPTNMMSGKWLEQFDGFPKDTESNIWNQFAPNNMGEPATTLHMVRKFAQTFDEYTNYLGKHMRPADEGGDLFVPFHRDENMEWALEFNSMVHDYRQKLNSICREMYIHMPFASNIPE